MVTTVKQKKERKFLTPEEKWECFVLMLRGEATATELAQRFRVDISVMNKIRRDGKNACMAAFAAKPGRPGKTAEQVQIEELTAERDELSATVTRMAVERMLEVGKGTWA